MSKTNSDGKLTPDLFGLAMVDRFCTELSEEAGEFRQDNQRLAATAASRKALANYRGFPEEAVDWLVSKTKIGISQDGEWTLPFEGFFRSDQGIHHRVFGRQIKGIKNWRCAPSDSPLPNVPFVLGDYLKAETIIVTEGAWDAMALAIASGWHQPGCFPLNYSILGVRGVHALKGLFGFVGKLLEGRKKFLILAQNDEPGLGWIRQPDLSRGLIEKASGIWLTHVNPKYGKDINDAYRRGAFESWSLGNLLNELEPGLHRPKDLNYGPFVFRKHLERIDPSIIPHGQRLYGVNGAKEDFPLHAFPPLLQRLAEEQSRIHKIEVPQSCLSILGAASNAIGTSIVAKNFAPGRITHGNIFTLITSPPGSGKTTLLRFFDPIREKEIELQAHFKKEVYPKLKDRQRKLEKELKLLDSPKKNGNAPSRPAEEIFRELRDVEEALQANPALIVGKSTTPCMVRTIMSYDKHIFQILDESSAQIFQVLGLGVKNEESPDLDFYLSQYSNSPYSNDTVTRGRITAQGWLGLTWLMQPVVKQRLQSSREASGRGFFARCLFVDAKNTEIPTSDDLSEPCQKDWEAYKKGIEALLEFRGVGKPEVLPCDDDGRKLLNEINNEEVHFRNSLLRQWRDCFGRQREHAIKIYILIYALDKAFADQEVSQTFCLHRLKRAICLAKWFHEELAGMLTADTGYRSRGALDRILNWINSCRGSMVSQGDINENRIGIDKFRTIWSLFPDQLLGWKSFSERGRPTLFFGTST
jgi:energy-coupling factor transporter ATP-binding protein EcfA2